MGEFLTGPVGSALRVAAGSVLGSVVTLLSVGGKITDLGDVTFWNAALGLAVAVAIPILIASLNSADTRFGRGSTPNP